MPTTVFCTYTTEQLLHTTLKAKPKSALRSAISRPPTRKPVKNHLVLCSEYSLGGYEVSYHKADPGKIPITTAGPQQLTQHEAPAAQAQGSSCRPGCDLRKEQVGSQTQGCPRSFCPSGHHSNSFAKASTSTRDVRNPMNRLEG